MRTLVRASLAAGPHRVSWDGVDQLGRRAPAGMYFAVLDGEQARAVTRLVRID